MLVIEEIGYRVYRSSVLSYPFFYKYKTILPPKSIILEKTQTQITMSQNDKPRLSKIRKNVKSCSYFVLQ